MMLILSRTVLDHIAIPLQPEEAPAEAGLMLDLVDIIKFLSGSSKHASKLTSFELWWEIPQHNP